MEQVEVILEDNYFQDRIMSSPLGDVSYEYKVEGDGSYMPASEDEIIEVEHLLGGPKDDLVLDDGVLYMDSENSQKCLAIEDFPCPIGYCEIKNADGLDSGTIQEGRPEMNSKFEARNNKPLKE